MSKIVKIGIVGCGTVVQRSILPHLSQHDVRDQVKIQAVMDPVKERAKATKEKFGAEEWYDDYDQMLEKADIEAVTISSPIPLHYEQSMKAVAAGKHVHCHKPVAMTLFEANKLVEAVNRSGVIYVASPGNAPVEPATVKMRELVREESLGKVYFALVGGGYPHEFEDMRVGDTVLSNVDASWYYTSEGPPFTVSSNTVYRIHSLVSILGSVKRVTGFSGIVINERVLRDKTVKLVQDDNTLLVCDFDDSVYAYIMGSLSLKTGLPSTFISCSKGSIVRTGAESLEIYRSETGFTFVGGGGKPSTRETWKSSQGLPYVNGIHLKLPDPHVYYDIMHLVDCIINNKPPIVFDNVLSLDIARHVIEIIEKGWIASKTGKTQELETSLTKSMKST